MARIATVKPTSQGLIFLAILAGVGLLICIGVYVMMSGQLSVVSTDLANREKQVQENKRIAERLQMAEEKYQIAEAQVSFLESSVSTRDYIPTLLKQLEQLGKSVNLKVLSVRPKIDLSAQKPKPVGAASTDGQANETSAGKTAQPAEKKKPYDSQTIDIEVEGTYANLMSLLFRINSFPKVLEVNSIQISPDSQGKNFGSPQLTMQLNVTAYVFPAQSQDVIPGAIPSKDPTQVTENNDAKTQRASYEHG